MPPSSTKLLQVYKYKDNITQQLTLKQIKSGKIYLLSHPVYRISGISQLKKHKRALQSEAALPRGSPACYPSRFHTM